jgi:hypothetical protein
MASVFEISPEEIELLTPGDFVDFMNHLLRAEASKSQISSTDVRTSLSIYAPDEGIDAAIDSAPKVTSDWLGATPSIWQFRSSKMPASDIRAELQKPTVQEYIRRGYSYFIACGVGYVPEKIQEYRDKMKEYCLEKGLPFRGGFFGASDLACWASLFPSMVLLSYFRRPIAQGEVVRIEDWEKMPRYSTPAKYHADDLRQGIIGKIREFADSLGLHAVASLRIEGEAGVGKTRLILEALKVSEQGKHLAIYATSPGFLPKGIFQWVRANPSVRCIIVIDECDVCTHGELTQHAETCQGRAILVTIGQGTKPSTTDLPKGVFFLNRLSNRDIEEIVRGVNPELGLEATSYIAHLTEGYVKLAVEIAKTITPVGATATEVANTYTTRNILESMLPEEKERRVMKALSLLTQVGMDDELSNEAETLARFIELTKYDLQEVAGKMRERGLVEKMGRYRYVTPRLLAIWLAKQVWEERRSETVNLLKSLPSPESRKAFLRQLQYLPDDPTVRWIAESLLSEEWFPDIASLNDDNMSETFSIMATINPQAGMQTLERIIRPLSREELLNFKNGRRHTVQALEKLAWLPETFHGAARLLLALAEAENESWSNNTTGVWEGLFSIYLSGTAVPAIERYKVLEEAIASESVDRRVLGVIGLKSALSERSSRMTGGEYQGGRLVPREWYPSTWSEVREAYKYALHLLDKALNDPRSEVRDKALEVLKGSAGVLLHAGMIEEFFKRVANLKNLSEEQKRTLRNALRWVEKFRSELLSDDQRSEVKRLITVISGTSFGERLRRWVGQLSSADWTGEIEGGEPTPGQQAESLAGEAFKNPELFYSELDWLASPEAEHVVSFAIPLGILDVDATFLPALIEKAREGKGITLLAAYLLGRRKAGADEWVENLLDSWLSESFFSQAILRATLYGRPSSRAAKRLVTLVDSRNMEPNELRDPMMSEWCKGLALNEFTEIMQRLLIARDEMTTRETMGILTRYLEVHPEVEESIMPIVWELVQRYEAVSGDTMSQYYWKGLANLSVRKNPLRVAKTLISFLGMKDANFYLKGPLREVLHKATRLVPNPNQLWREIGKKLLADSEEASRLLHRLAVGYIDLFDPTFLISWAKENKPKGPVIIAKLASIGQAALSELVRGLLIEFGDDRNVTSYLFANFWSGSWSGSAAEHFEEKRKIAEGWTKDKHPNVRKFALSVVRSLEKDVERWRREEEEEFPRY